MSEATKLAHDGYANGSPVLDHATWEGAVRRLLASSSEVEEEVNVVGGDGVQRKEKVKRLAHETDGWDHGRWNRKVPRPGPVPALVTSSAIRPDAKTERHEHDVEIPPPNGVDLAAYHHARHLVVLARQRRAKAVAVLPPRPSPDDPGRLVLETILVL